MNGALLLIVSSACFALAYFVYSRFIAKLLGVDSSRPTPAIAMKDGVDYVPAPAPVLFGHHFASIAGAGPIVGPILAAEFGWVAVALWVVLGCIFIGAAHDMMALFLSVRHRGQSIASVIDSVAGRPARICFLLFCLVALILVCAEFTRLVAVTFTQRPEVATSSLLFILEATVFGLCVYRKGMSLLRSSLVFVTLMFVFVWVGSAFPLDLCRLGLAADSVQSIWTVALLAYCFLASTLPVWLLLQPRDYLNSYLLYVMVAAGLCGVVFAAPAIEAPAFAGFELPSGKSLMPFLFVTVACGACSGFHALVASGTTAKQLASERHIRPVAYGGMLLEGVLAILALVAVAYLSPAAFAEKTAAGHTPVMLFASGIASFCGKFGVPTAISEIFFSLAIAAFLMTSVDTATRLARFIFEELVHAVSAPAVRPDKEGKKRGMNMYVSTGVVVGLVALLLFCDRELAKSLWTMFASANQMLAAFTLLTAALWLFSRRRNGWIAFVPMLVMLITSATAVVQLFAGGVKRWMAQGFGAGGAVAFGALILLVLCASLLVSSCRCFYRLICDRKRNG